MAETHDWTGYFVASELKDPICHSNECQIGSFSSEATICRNELSLWFLIPREKKRVNP